MLCNLWYLPPAGVRSYSYTEQHDFFHRRIHSLGSKPTSHVYVGSFVFLPLQLVGQPAVSRILHVPRHDHDVRDDRRCSLAAPLLHSVLPAQHAFSRVMSEKNYTVVYLLLGPQEYRKRVYIHIALIYLSILYVQPCRVLCLLMLLFGHVLNIEWLRVSYCSTNSSKTTKGEHHV